MAKKKLVASAASDVSQNPSESNGESPERERTIVTEFTLKLQRHKDIPTVPTVLDSLQDWAKSKGYVVVKKETSTPGYYSWTIHTSDSAREAELRAHNVMKEVRSLREDPTVQAQANKLGITVDELLKRTLASIRQQS